MVEDPVQRVCLPTPPGRDGGQLEILVKQVPGEAREKWHDRGRLNQTASQCIGNLHVSSDDGVDQTGHTQKRIAAQFQRIAKAVVYPAQNDIDLLQTIDSL